MFSYGPPHMAKQKYVCGEVVCDYVLLILMASQPR